MKKIYPFYLFALVLFVFVGCKKKVVLPNITTLSVSNIFANEAISGGVISSQGTGNILSRGVVWSTSPNPTISLSTKSTDSSGVGTFSSKLFGLSANTKYYVRAYAAIATGTAYGNEISFTTNDIDLKRDLVAYYPFSGNAGDSSGNGNHGVVNGAVLTSDRFGKLNSAYSFVNNTISVPYKSYLTFSDTKKFSVSFWVYTSINNVTTHYLGMRQPGSGTQFWQIYAAVAAGNGIFFGTWINSNVLGVTSLNQQIPTNTWNNLICTYENGNWKMFINGILIASSKSSIAFNNDINTPLTIGNSGNFEPFNGKLDDVRIYNRALTQSEITYLANN